MQLLTQARRRRASGEDCGRELLDTVPLVMRVIRSHMCRHRSGLTVPQFRTLCYLSTFDGSSLSAAADFIGLSLPAMSRLVDGLVGMGLVERRSSSDDRRHLRLSVTPGGAAAVDEARALAQAELSDAVQGLSPKQRQSLVSTMRVLRDVFGPDPAAAEADPRRPSR